MTHVERAGDQPQAPTDVPMEPFLCWPVNDAPTAKTIVDPAPSTAALLNAAAGARAFSVAWSGWIIAPRDDAYTFATVSDAGSWVYVDGELVLENHGSAAPALESGETIRLSRGPH